MLIVRKNQVFTQTYCVAKHRKGEFVGVVSGMGKNQGTWNSDHSKRTAQRYAAKLRIEDPDHRFYVVESA